MVVLHSASTPRYGVPEVLQRGKRLHLHPRRPCHPDVCPMISRPVPKRGNNNTSTTPRHNNRDETATTTPNLADYSRRRTRAMLRRRHGSRVAILASGWRHCGTGRSCCFASSFNCSWFFGFFERGMRCWIWCSEKVASHWSFQRKK